MGGENRERAEGAVLALSLQTKKERNKEGGGEKCEVIL